MAGIRLIPRLDIKGPNLIKGIHLEGLRVVGDPQEHARRYYEQGADELIYMDIVASLYGRNSLRDIVSRTAQDVFIPLTVGGGVRSVDDVRELLRAGADKVTINTAAVKRPELIAEVSRAFGSQCMVLSIEAKRIGNSRWVHVQGVFQAALQPLDRFTSSSFFNSWSCADLSADGYLSDAGSESLVPGQALSAGGDAGATELVGNIGVQLF